MCERSHPLEHPTYQLRDLLVLLDDVTNRLSQVRPSVHTDEVMASVQQHRQMVARWLGHPPSRTVQANAASTILSVIASANAAAHAAHFDTGSWRPVQAELRAAQHSQPEAGAPLYFDLSGEQGRGIAQAVLNGDLVPTPLPWLPKAGTKRVCEVRVEGVEEPIVLIAQCAGIETPDGVLLSLVPASRRQHGRVKALAEGTLVEARTHSREELPTLTEDDIRGATRRQLAASRARQSSARDLAPVASPVTTSAPELLAEETKPLETVAPEHEDLVSSALRSTEVIFDDTLDAIDDPPTVDSSPELSTVRPPPPAPIEALLQRYCAELDEPTMETPVPQARPLAAEPQPRHEDEAWRTPITLPPPGLAGLASVSPMPPARLPQPVFVPSDDLPKTEPPPPMLETQPPPPMMSAARVPSLASLGRPSAPPKRPMVKTQELPDLLFANAPVGKLQHHSDVAYIGPVGNHAQSIASIGEDRDTPAPTVVSLDEQRPLPRRRRRGGAMLLAASIALGLFASPAPNTSTPDVARSFAPATTRLMETAKEASKEAKPTEMVTVKRTLLRKARD